MANSWNEHPFSGEPSSLPDTEPRFGRDHGSFSSLVGELIGETAGLIRAEMALARTEMQENLHGAQRGIAVLAAGSVAVVAGLLALVAAAILALAPGWPDWLAALVVGLAVLAVGSVLLSIGKRKTGSEGLRPRRTLSSFEEAKEFARQESDRAARRWR